MKTNGNKHGVRKHSARPDKHRYLLYLYITGNTVRSLRSIAYLRNLCETHLKGRYDLKVIDICQQPQLAAEGQILAAPTLVKRFPLPLRRLVGDFSNRQRVEMALNLTTV